MTVVYRSPSFDGDSSHHFWRYLGLKQVSLHAIDSRVTVVQFYLSLIVVNMLTVAKQSVNLYFVTKHTKFVYRAGWELSGLGGSTPSLS